MKLRLILRSIELLLRILCGLIIISILINYAELTHFSLLIVYEFASALFYIFLLILIIFIIRKGRKNGLMFNEIEKYLNYLKWVFVLETMFLLSIKLVIINRLIGEAQLKPVDFSAITTPNLGFIIISLLIFFLSAVLKERNQLKEEQNLTI